MNTASVVLNTTGVQWPGGRGLFAAAATFGGGSVSLEALAPDGATWYAVPNAATGVTATASRIPV